MTARLATHPEVASREHRVLELLVTAGLDVEVVALEPRRAGAGPDPLHGVRVGSLDLALVGFAALRGSAVEDLTTVAVLPRGEFRDVLLTLRGRPATLRALPAGARVGVCGVRRRSFLRAHRPEVEPVELERADAADLLARTGELDAAVVSSVEGRSAGLAGRVTEVLDPRAWLPDPGEGALALVARHPIAEATALDHLPTRTALRAELALLDALGVEADAAVGAVAQTSGRSIRLWAAAASHDGRRLVRSELTGPLDEPEAVGASVARELRRRGIGLVLEAAAG